MLAIVLAVLSTATKLSLISEISGGVCRRYLCINSGVLCCILIVLYVPYMMTEPCTISPLGCTCMRSSLRTIESVRKNLVEEQIANRLHNIPRPVC